MSQKQKHEFSFDRLLHFDTLWSQCKVKQLTRFARLAFMESQDQTLLHHVELCTLNDPNVKITSFQALVNTEQNNNPSAYVNNELVKLLCLVYLHMSELSLFRFC